MDLMLQSTTWALLKTKYREFAAPTAHVVVEGSDLRERFGAQIGSITVDLSCGYEASGCSFEISGEYEPEQTDFTGGAARLLELGARVEVGLGYIAAEVVFSGLITEVEYQFDEDDAPLLHVECMDAKCLLMKTQKLELCRESRLDRAVSALLSEQPAAGYLKGKRVEPVAADVQMLPIYMETSYEFLVRQARYAGCEFFIVAGIAYFRPQPASGQPLMRIGAGNGLLSARLSLRGEQLVKTVKVVGIDPATDRELMGAAAAGGRFGRGAAPPRMLAGTQRIYFDARASTPVQARERAKVLLEELQREFGVLECRCVGLPELVPGRLIQVEGLSERATGSFYITSVRHMMDEDGFTTVFEARRGSL